MPTVMRWNGYRFFFYSLEGNEPPHIHVVKDGKELKVWLSNFSIANNVGFKQHEINTVLPKIQENSVAFIEAWHAYFGN
jgi:hypothetical protein